MTSVESDYWTHAAVIGTAFITTAHLVAALLPSKPQPAAPGTTLGALPPAATGQAPALLLGAAAAGTVLFVLILVLVARVRRRRCLHCQRALRRGSLVAVGRLDEIGGCMSCAIKVHNSGGALLCRPCLRSHLRPREHGVRHPSAV